MTRLFKRRRFGVAQAGSTVGSALTCRGVGAAP
jgi:hypothetical protein